MLRQVPENLIRIRFLISSDEFAFSVYSDIEFVGADQRSDFNWDSSLHPPLPIPNYGLVYNWFSVHITFTLNVLIFSEYLFYEMNSESGSLLDHRGDLNLNQNLLLFSHFIFCLELRLSPSFEET